MEPFIGQLLLASFNFTPRGFLPASAQTLPINQYQALFSLFGTTFGGNGTTTFNLPDLRGRVPVHQGNYQGTTFSMGQVGGEESHTITASETPQHNHQVIANKTANITNPAGAFLGGGGAAVFNSLPSSPSSMNQSVISTMGGSQPHENRQPFLVLNWVVAITGIFPSRS